MPPAVPSQRIMDAQLEFYMDQKLEVFLFLSNGIRLSGRILKFDSSDVVLTSEHQHPEGVTTSRLFLATIMRKGDRPANQHQQHQEDRPPGSADRRHNSR
jgi:hypothetical protein